MNINEVTVFYTLKACYYKLLILPKLISSQVISSKLSKKCNKNYMYTL